MMNNPYKTGMNPYGYPMYTPAGSSLPQTGIPVSPAASGGSFFPGTPPVSPVSPAAPAGPSIPGQLPLEQSFIENILRLNLGKVATFYMTYENNREWNAKIFKGRLEAAGRDHIIISDPATGMRILLLMVNLDYVTFDEELQYTYPFGTGAGR